MRRKLAAVAAAVLMVSLPTVILAVFVETQLVDVRATSRSTQALLDDLGTLESTTLDAGGAVLFHTIRGGEGGGHVEDYRAAMERIPDLINRLEEGMPAEFDRQMQEVTAAVDEHAATLDPLILDELAEDIGTLLEMFTAGNVAQLEVREAIGELELMLDERLTAQRQDVTGLERAVTTAVALSWIITFVAVFGAAALLTTDVVRRVERLSENARRFVQGERLLPLRQSNDEVGQLIGGISAVGGLLEERRQEAVAATRAKNEFLSRISHELRGPLTTIRDLGQTLDQDDDLSPDDHDAARHIVRGGQHLLILIDDLLDISKIETGRLSITTRPVPLRSTVDEAVALTQPRAATRAITITTDCPQDLAVQADRQRLTQILLNLLSNAVKYNRPSGHIDITATRHDGTIRIAVTDTGPGITPEGQRRLFRPFERLDAAKTSTEGSGIGLALTKNLVDAMDGTIGIESQPGHGSTFYVDLPVAAPEGQAPPTRPTEPELDPTGLEDAPLVLPETAEAAFHDQHELEQSPADSAAATPEGIRRGPRRPPHRRIAVWWQNLAIRRKLTAAATAALLVSLPTVAVVIWLELQLSDARSTARSTEELLDDVNGLQDASLDLGATLLSYSLGEFQDERYVAEYDQLKTDIAELEARLDERLPPEFDEQMQMVTAALEARLPTVDRLFFQDEPEEGETFTEMYTASILTSEQVRQVTGTLEAMLDERLGAQRQDVTDLEGLVARAVVVSWIVTFVAVIGAAALLTTDVARRIERLADNGRRFLQGRTLLPLRQSHDEVGHLIGSIAAVGGLLDQRRVEAEAATRTKNEFLSRISHELRTPLTAIIGFGEILEDEELSPENHDAARRIAQGGQHLLTLIDDLLDLSKVETGHLPLTAEPVPVNEVIDEAVALTHARAAARSITIDTEQSPGLLAIADRQRLGQVLHNLLSNAVKYNRPSGHIDITATRHDGTIRIAVTDTGPGITPEDQQRLFRPFGHLDTETDAATDADADADETRGTGIGLALTKLLVEAMGGSIHLDSEPGRGSTFSVELPAPADLDADADAEGDSDETGAPTPEDADQRSDDRPVILYADRNAADTARMERLFQERPERLQTMSDGNAVLGFARLLRPRLIVLAAEGLPDMDGEAVLMQMKSHPDTADIAVVILAADATPQLTDLMLVRGAHAVLARPINTAQFASLLDAVSG